MQEVLSQLDICLPGWRKALGFFATHPVGDTSCAHTGDLAAALARLGSSPLLLMLEPNGLPELDQSRGLAQLITDISTRHLFNEPERRRAAEVLQLTSPSSP